MSASVNRLNLPDKKICISGAVEDVWFCPDLGRFKIFWGSKSEKKKNQIILK